jgi:N-acetylneuraminic acid mutarotase
MNRLLLVKSLAKSPMKKKQNASLSASALKITFISVSAILLTLGASPARNQFENNPAGMGVTLKGADRHAAVSEFSAASRFINARKLEHAEFSVSHQRVDGREITGFSARQTQATQEENLTPPAGLKPVEQEAWLEMARRQPASGSMGLASFYPARYGEPFVVEGEGVRVALRPVGGTGVTAHIDNGQVIYREAYSETDSVHVASAGRSEEFLFLQNECAPREFTYELSELSAGTHVELVKGEVRFTNEGGHGVKIEAPWLIEATGAQPAGAVRWELEENKSGALPRLRLVVAKGLIYPVLIDPSWVTTGSMVEARYSHTATLLPSGKVLVAGGTGSDGRALGSAELYDPATGSWSSTGSFFTKRGGHAATLLPSGKVLVAGGYGDFTGALSSAELYDPATGTWTPTSSLGTARAFYTATLLPSGKVLVAGGSSFSESFNSAELYDPATGSWSTTGSLSTKRGFHTATLLPSGKVLVAGGSSGTLVSRSAELYDPATGGWSTTGSLGTKRAGHTATLLSSGKVLVVGGSNFPNYFNSAELYDPATGLWTATGSLITARSQHTATLLPSGKVLVAGGRNSDNFWPRSVELYDPATGSWSNTGSLTTERQFHAATLLPSGKVLVEGGAACCGATSSAEFYDPATGSWSSTSNLGTARRFHAATLLPSGKVLVTGGIGISNVLSSAELYDPATGLWTATGSLGTARYAHTATLLPSGKVLVTGGYRTGPLSSAELYDSTTGLWTSTGSLGTARYSHTATLLPSGKVLVAGGIGSGSSYSSSAELYDPAMGSWSSTGSLNTARASHTATLLPSAKVLVAGGSNPGFLSSAELYDPAMGSWSSTGSLGTARASHTATLLPSGKVLVAGGLGSGSSSLSSAELYDPAMGSWSSTGSLGTARASHTATMLPSAKVLVAGGLNPSSLSSAELYDPATGSWSSPGSLGTARASHTATQLPSGNVLVAGGFSDSSSLSSVELYDSGLGFDPSWQPLLTSVSPSILPNGGALTVSGSRFKGISEASGGNNFQNSSSNYPLVQLLSLANEQTLFLGVDAMTGWSDTSFTSTPITLMTTSSSGFPIGHALVTVFANGIAGQSQFVVGTMATPSPTATPTSVRVNVGTNPVGRTFSVDGTTYSSQQQFTWAAGSSHTIATTSPQSGGSGVQYVWGKWSDHGTISHTIIPTTNKTYTATFQTQYFLTMIAGTGGTVTPASGWQDAGRRVTIRARPNPGFTFVDWVGSGTGSYTGTNDPASITMDGPISEMANFSP